MKKIKKGIKFILFILAGIFLFTISLPNNLFAQGNLNATISHQSNLNGHQADRWYFGQNAGLDFRGQDPVFDPTNYILNIPTSPAVIADSNGNILFFSEGTRVYNDSNQIMLNGEGFHGFVGYSMPVLIVPKPGNDSIYYIFTTHRPRQNQFDPSTIYGLEYNEINMNKDSGLGEVVQKNIVLLQPEVSSRLSAVKHSNGVDYWIMGHRYDSVDLYRAREFCAFLVTEDGINPNYVSSIIGSEHGGNGNWGDSNKGIGYMKFSPDGSKLAIAILGSNLFEIFNFDRSTGKVTNSISSGPIFIDAYGIEFSPDSKYLYATSLSTALPVPGNIPPSYLFQFDLSVGETMFITGFYDTIAADTSGSYFGGIQLGTDGRIYVSRSPYGNSSLSVIQNPKRQGPACNFTSNAIYLQGKTCHFGFPNFVSSYFDLPHFEVSNTALGDTVVFTLQNNSNIDEIFWQFGDPASGSNTSSEMQPKHVFSSPGIYQVQVTEYFNGVEYGTYGHAVEIKNYQLISENIANHALFSIYPNPGNGIINLVFKQDLKEAVISVGNIFGQTVWGPVKIDGLVENEEICIDLVHLPAGLYFIEVLNEDKAVVSVKYLLAR